MSELNYFNLLIEKSEIIKEKKSDINLMQAEAIVMSYMIILTYSFIIYNKCSICLFNISQLIKIFDFFDDIVYLPKLFGKTTYTTSPCFLKLIDSNSIVDGDVITSYINVSNLEVMGISHHLKNLYVPSMIIYL